MLDECLSNNMYFQLISIDFHDSDRQQNLSEVAFAVPWTGPETPKVYKLAPLRPQR